MPRAKRRDGAHHLREAHRVGVEHRAAAHRAESRSHSGRPGRCRRRAARCASSRMRRAFVHQRIHQALDDFLVVDLAARDAELGRVRSIMAFDFGVRIGRCGRPGGSRTNRRRSSGRSGPSRRAGRRSCAYVDVAAFGDAALADRPADVVAGQVAHAERPHGEAERSPSRGPPAAGRQPSSSRKPAWRRIAMQHAVADEAVAHAGDDGELLDLLRQAA